ncbi:MAG: helix-turn-helix domain-containing protein [Ginsengibacter sp.]
MTTNYILIPMEISEFWKELKSIVEQAVLKHIPQKPPVQLPIEGFPTLLKVKEVCELLGVSKPTIYEWMREGKIPSLKLGAHRLFDAADIEAVIQKSKSKENNKD